MTSVPSATPMASPAGVVRILCAVVLLLMAGAVTYGVATAIRYFGVIGV